MITTFQSQPEVKTRPEALRSQRVLTKISNETVSCPAPGGGRCPETVLFGSSFLEHRLARPPAKLSEGQLLVRLSRMAP